MQATVTNDPVTRLLPFLKQHASFKVEDGVAVFDVPDKSDGLKANEYYFDQEEWRDNYLKYVHRSKKFRLRWLKATGVWDDAVVVDVGCGPGNVAACLKQTAKLLIGIDVSRGALSSAARFGYVPVYADAHDLPLVSECADVVIANAALHHCDDMKRVLAEAARLVKPNGVLVTDHDPQLSAWNYKWLGLLLWKSRLVIYRIKKKGFHRSATEQSTALTSEIHHEAGDGVTAELYESVLKPMGFEVKLFPHNHDLGDEVFEGRWGRSSKKFRIAQVLSGINPDRSTSALSLMCVARRTG